MTAADAQSNLIIIMIDRAMQILHLIVGISP